MNYKELVPVTSNIYDTKVERRHCVMGYDPVKRDYYVASETRETHYYKELKEKD